MGSDVAPTVLVVDDDPVWRATLGDWLAHEGFHVVELSRGEAVPPAVEVYRPAVVILDKHLQGWDGLALLGFLQHRWPTLPIVLMTAFGEPGLADRARRLGAASYLDKPFRVNDLVREVRRVAEVAGAERGTMGRRQDRRRPEERRR